MKSRWGALLVAIGIVFAAQFSSADLKRSELGRPALLTQGGALLNQVDLLCLYFSSERVAHAAFPFAGNRVEVETTVLDETLLTDPDALHNFVSRQITTFVDVLRQRLGVYAPALAKSFDAQHDIRFVIDGGHERFVLAFWEGGQWRWAEAGSVPPPALNAARVQTSAKTGKLWCDCPALRKKK